MSEARVQTLICPVDTKVANDFNLLSAYAFNVENQVEEQFGWVDRHNTTLLHDKGRYSLKVIYADTKGTE